MEILLADDNSEVRSALRLYLEQDPLPVEVMEISNVHELIVTLRENCPSAVLLDWELPGFYGRELLMDLRSVCPGIKVIAMSCKFGARQDALRDGADAFISKSEPPEQILSTLCALFVPTGKQ